MTLCQTPVVDGGLALAGKRQLAGMTALSSEDECGVQGRRRRRPQGAKPWTPGSSSDTPIGDARIGGRTAEATDDRGRFDDESR